MKRRNRVLLMGMLTGIWLFVQLPFAHAHVQHMPLAATAGEPAAQAAVEAGEAPCHGDDHPAPDMNSDVIADAHASGDADPGTICCDGGQCEGHCAQLSWALAAPIPQRFVRGMAWLASLEVAGPQRVHQPEPFRPPI